MTILVCCSCDKQVDRLIDGLCKDCQNKLGE